MAPPIRTSQSVLRIQNGSPCNIDDMQLERTLHPSSISPLYPAGQQTPNPSTFRREPLSPWRISGVVTKVIPIISVSYG